MDNVLTIDLGNTSTHFVLWNKGKILAETRVDTIKNDLSNYKTKLLEASGNFVFNDVYVASVVPICLDVIQIAFPNAKVAKFDDFGDIDFSLMKADVTGMGPDRLTAIKAVMDEDSTNIIFDLGTATNVEIVKGHQYQGGLIFPGYQVTINALIEKATLLKQLDGQDLEPTLFGLQLSEQVFGAHKQAQITMIDGLISEYRAIFPDVNIYLTGGFSNIVAKYIKNEHIHDPYLIHKGLIRLFNV